MRCTLHYSTSCTGRAVHKDGERLIKLGPQKNAPYRILVLPFCSIASHGQSRIGSHCLFTRMQYAQPLQRRCLTQIGVDGQARAALNRTHSTCRRLHTIAQKHHHLLMKQNKPEKHKKQLIRSSGPCCPQPGVVPNANGVPAWDPLTEK